MKLLASALAISLAFAAGCDRGPTTPPSPKTDTSSTVPQAAAGSTATPNTRSSANGTPSAAEKREGANPVQGQVDPKHAEQQRDFQHRGDAAGPKSSDTQPTTKN
jgi:hypothetical protein